MLDPDADPITGLPVGEDAWVEPLTAEPTPAQVAFLARLVAEETASLNAPDEPPSLWAATERLAARARTAETLARKAQAVGLREVYALFHQVLADDAAQFRCVRPEALEFADDEIASALGVSRRTAQIRVEDALNLVGSCRRTLALLECGVLAYPAARALAKETCQAPQELREQVESRVLELLGAGEVEDLGSFRAQAIGPLAALRPEACWRIGQAATRGRVIRLARQAIVDLAVEVPEPEPTPSPADVEAFPTRQGRVMFGAEITEADACLAWANVHQHARRLKKAPGETRSMGELRAQAFADLVTGRIPGGGVARGDNGGLAPTPFEVRLTVDATGRASTPRFGAVHPDTVRQIIDAAKAAGGHVRVRTVTTPTCPGGHDSAEPDPHDPSPALDATIRMRDKVCRFPGCTIPAGRCDVDHNLPWPHGPTCECNLCALCRHHHRLKTHGRWTVTNHGNGHLTWTTPTGRVIHSRPDP